MSMKREELQEMLNRAKDKDDGIYTYLGIKYGVKNKSLKIIYYSGTLYQFSYGFLVSLGKIRYGWQPKMKQLLKDLEG